MPEEHRSGRVGRRHVSDAQGVRGWAANPEVLGRDRTPQPGAADRPNPEDMVAQADPVGPRRVAAPQRPAVEFAAEPAHRDVVAGPPLSLLSPWRSYWFET